MVTETQRSASLIALALTTIGACGFIFGSEERIYSSLLILGVGLAFFFLRWVL